MKILRERAMADVDARIISGELKSFLDVHKVIQQPPSPGECKYGEELEGDFPKKGEHWATAADTRRLQADADDLANLPSTIAASPLGDALVEKAATRIHDKIKELRKCYHMVGVAGLPNCRFTISRRITDLERSENILKNCRGKDIHAHLSAQLRLEALTFRNKRDAARKKNAGDRKRKQRAKAAKAAALERLWTFKQEKKERQKALLRCGGDFGLKELGEGPRPHRPTFIKARLKCLEQIRMASPVLPVSVEATWERVSKAYAQECSNTYKFSTGTKFFQKVQMVIAELGVHYLNHKEVKEKLTPQTVAYLKANQKKFDDKLAFRDFVIGLKVWVPKSMMNVTTG